MTNIGDYVLISSYLYSPGYVFPNNSIFKILDIEINPKNNDFKIYVVKHIYTANTQDMYVVPTYNYNEYYLAISEESDYFIKLNADYVESLYEDET